MLLKPKTDFMNTSNKILAGFFLIIFIVPAMMVMAFKSKIRRNDYKIVNRDSFANGNWKTGKLQSPKVVKLVGIAGNALKVNVNYADAARYNYATGSRDSIKMVTIGDTIEIHYTFTGSPNDIADANLYLDLSLPRLERLIAENVEVNIISLDTSGAQSLVIDLNGTSRLSIGKNEGDQYLPTSDNQAIRLSRLAATVDNSALNIGKGVTIGEMNIDVTGKSRLVISKDAVIGNISGKLSDSSRVDANWNYLKQLNSLQAQ